MERISGGGQAQAPPPSSTTPSQPASATVLLPGTSIDVRVLQALSAGRFLLALGDQQFVASSAAPLQPGTQVRLNVAAAGDDGIVLRLDEPVRAEVSAAPGRLAALRLPATPAAAAVLAAFEDAGAPLDPVRLQAALRAAAEPHAPATTAQAHALLARSGLPSTPALVQVALRAAEARLPDVADATRRSSAPVALPDAEEGAPAIMRAFALAGVRPLPAGRVALPAPATADRPAPATARWGSPGAPAVPAAPTTTAVRTEATALVFDHHAGAPREARLTVQASGTYAKAVNEPELTSSTPSTVPRNTTLVNSATTFPPAANMPSPPRPAPAPGDALLAPQAPAQSVASVRAPTVSASTALPAAAQTADQATADPLLVIRNPARVAPQATNPAPHPSDRGFTPVGPGRTPPATTQPIPTSDSRLPVPATSTEQPPATRAAPVSSPLPVTPSLAAASPPGPARITILASGSTSPPNGQQAAMPAAATQNVPGTSTQRPAASAQQPIPSGQPPAANGQLPAPVNIVEQTSDAIAMPTLVRQIVKQALAATTLPDLHQPMAERQATPTNPNPPTAPSFDVPVRQPAILLPPVPPPTEPAAATPAQLTPAAMATDAGTSHAVREHLAEQVFKAKDLNDYDRVVPLPLATTQTTTPARLAVATRTTGNGTQATFVRVDADMSRLGPVSLRLSGSDAGGPLAITLVAGPAAGALLAEQLPALIEDLRRIGVDAAVRVVSDG